MFQDEGVCTQNPTLIFSETVTHINARHGWFKIVFQVPIDAHTHKAKSTQKVSSCCQDSHANALYYYVLLPLYRPTFKQMGK